jgi:hypothetical protein
LFIKSNKWLIGSLHLANVFALVVLPILFKRFIDTPFVFPADFDAHLKFISDPTLNEASGYSLMHQIIGVTNKLVATITNQQYQVTLVYVFIFFIVLACILTYFVLYKYFNKSYNNPVKAMFFALALSFVSMLIINFTSHFYIGTWSPNPWHSPTYLFAKPFCIVSFLLSLHVLQSTKHSIFPLLLTSIVLALATWAKPSFTLSFAPAICIYVFILVLMKQKSIQDLVVIACLCVPSMLVIWQMNTTIYASGEATNKIIIQGGAVWQSFSGNIPVSIILGLAFPVYVLLVKIKRSTRMMQLAFINLICAIFIFYFLKENGDRATHANFSWTYMFAMFFMFLAAVDALYFQKPTTNKGILLIGNILFSLHLICGVIFFTQIFFGVAYYC